MNDVVGIGAVCFCSMGRPGLITGRTTLSWGEAWVGIGLDGKGPWSSRSPKLMTEAQIAVLDQGAVKACETCGNLVVKEGELPSCPNRGTCGGFTKWIPLSITRG